MTDASSISNPDPSRGVAVEFFDGESARPHRARLRVSGEAIEVLDANGTLLRRVPKRDVQWPERQRHGPRVAHFANGGMVQCNDGPAWDAFAGSAGTRDSLVVRSQQSWRAVLVACVVLIALIGAGYLWGLPAASRAIVAWVPEKVDQEIGRSVIGSIEARGWLQPSQLSADEQLRLRRAFERAVAATWPAGQRPSYELRFAKSEIGPNAFALPGGTMVLTDEMVKLVDAREDVIVGVLGHELGHVRQRHGMRMLVQFAVLNIVTSIAFGDFSSILATAPALLGQQKYSRDHEREADTESLGVLRGGGHSPEAMVVLFEKISTFRDKRKAEDGGKSSPFDLGIALSSHPADEERIRFFREAAAKR